MDAIQAKDPVTGEVVTVPSGTRTLPDPSSPTGTRLLTSAELQQVREANQSRDATILVGAVVVLAAGGYWWKGWKGAVGVPVGAAAAFLGLAVIYMGTPVGR